jgi:hypothetical protein
MEGWSLKAAVNDDDDQPSMPTSTEVSGQNLVKRTETPGRFDVLLGRGKKHTGYPGNERLMTVLNRHCVRYNATTSRTEKTIITQEIVESIQNADDRPGRFLKFDKGANGWVKVDDSVARKKVGHAIRYSSRYKNLKAPPANPEASLQEANTMGRDASSPMGSDASRRREAQQQERPRDRSNLVFDESTFAGLGHDIHFSNDDGASIMYNRSHQMEGWSSKVDANDDQKLTSTEASSLGRETTETPGCFDVLLGRGEKHDGHPGNERLQTVLNIHSVRYSGATAQHEKTAIAQEIVQTIQTAGDPPGRFLQFDEDANEWVKVDDAVARMKISHAIQYSSRHTKRIASPESFEASSAEATTLRSDNASRQGTVRGAHQQERSGGRSRSPLVSDEAILAGLGYDIHTLDKYEDSSAS